MLNLIEAPEEPTSGRMMVQIVKHTLATLRYRKNVVIVAVVLAGLLGAAYYATATRYYRAEIGMLIMQTGMDKLEQRSLMKTSENVIRSPKLIEAALKQLSDADHIDLAGVPRDRWVEVLQDNLKTQGIPATNVLEIRYDSKDPVTAVNMVNALVDAYLAFLEQTHRGTSTETNGGMTQGHAELRAALHEEKNQGALAKSVLGDLNSKDRSVALTSAVKRASFLTNQLSQIERQRIELETLLTAIQTAVRNDEDLHPHLIKTANVVGDSLLPERFDFSSADAQTKGSLEQSLPADRAEMQGMEEYHDPAHAETIAMQEKARMAEQLLDSSENESAAAVAQPPTSQIAPVLVRMVKQKLGETMAQKALLQSQFEASQAEAAELDNRLTALGTLEHEVQRLRDLSDVLVQQMATNDQSEAEQEIRLEVIAPPQPIDRPISPNLATVVLLAIAGGLGSGFMAVYLLDTFDDRFRSVDEIRHQLGVPVLSMVRPLRLDQTMGLGALQVHVHPAAAESEAFRTLRTALDLTDEHLRTLLVTSPEPGDGKTIVLANVGVCYAQSGKKTLLIDGDLRRRGLSTLLQMRRPKGFSDLLHDENPIAETAMAMIQPSGVENLDVLPCGTRLNHPAVLIAGARLTELIDWAASVYDRVLIDSPPILATSDAAVLGRQVDGVIMVVQPEKNRRRSVLHAIESLLSLRISLRGLVLNQVGSDRGRDYCSYDYGYGYGYGLGGDMGVSSDNQANDALSQGDVNSPTHMVPRRVA